VEIEGAPTKEEREPRENSDMIWKEKKGRASKLCSMTYLKLKKQMIPRSLLPLF
jgi:hypothetical protein